MTPIRCCARKRPAITLTFLHRSNVSHTSLNQLLQRCQIDIVKLLDIQARPSGLVLSQFLEQVRVTF
jgi:hypothetical protein